MEISIDARRVHLLRCDECDFEGEHVEGDIVEWAHVGNALDDHNTGCFREAMIEEIVGVIEVWGVTMDDGGFGKCEDVLTEIGPPTDRFPVRHPGPLDSKYWSSIVDRLIP